ncbi:MAG TPA: hypothetical protein VFH73_23410 [Polyangia bacterium]|jgi:hypothetical protein|nr:hypothetical protein [Polyangia bacterium]
MRGLLPHSIPKSVLPPRPNLWKAPPFEKLSLGWYNAQPSAIAIEMWMDDVAVDTKRIGCPPAP